MENQFGLHVWTKEKKAFFDVLYKRCGILYKPAAFDMVLTQKRECVKWLLNGGERILVNYTSEAFITLKL